jgi:hypothetical protein
MVERTVKQTLASYRDPGGTMRYALQGQTIDVGDTDVKRFDEANGAPESEDTPTPKRKPRKTT